MCGAHLRATTSTHFISVYFLHSGWDFRGKFIATLPTSSSCMTPVLAHSPEHHPSHGEVLGFLILKLIIWVSFLGCVILQWISLFSLPMSQCPWMLPGTYNLITDLSAQWDTEMGHREPEQLANCSKSSSSAKHLIQDNGILNFIIKPILKKLPRVF